jgi:predicted Zn-dependent peptidase
MKVLRGESGITILFRPMKTGLVDMRYLVMCGAVDESPAERGFCHALEHMVFAGTDKRSWLQINRDWEKLGTSYNAITAQDRTYYIATTLRRNWKECYEVLADMFYNCKFPTERWEDIEKPAIISEILDSLDDETSVLEEELYMHGIGDRYHPIMGDIETIKNASVSDLTNFYDRYYRGSSVLLFISGDLTEEEVLQEVNRYDRLRPSSPIRRQRFDFEFNHEDLDVIDPGIKQCYLQALLPLNVPRKYTTRTAIGVGVNCLSQFLFEELREKRGLVYGADASLYWDIPGRIFLHLQTATDKSLLEKTEAAFLEAIAKFPEEGLSGERIRNMKLLEEHVVTSDSEDLSTSADWMWDAWKEDVFEDPYSNHAKTVESLSVDSIRETTRTHVKGVYKLGRLVED